MREFWIVVFCLLTAPAFAQFEYAKPNLGQAIGEGALAATSEEPKIVLETIDNCPACKNWLRSEGIELLEKGWLLKVDRVIPSEGRLYPRWRVCFKDGCSVIEYTREFKQRLQAVIDARKKR